MRTAEIHKPRKGDGKRKNAECRTKRRCECLGGVCPLSWRRALRAATWGGSEPPDCRLQIARAGRGHRGMRIARNNEKAKRVPNDRRRSQIGPHFLFEGPRLISRAAGFGGATGWEAKCNTHEPLRVKSKN